MRRSDTIPVSYLNAILGTSSEHRVQFWHGFLPQMSISKASREHHSGLALLTYIIISKKRKGNVSVTFCIVLFTLVISSQRRTIKSSLHFCSSPIFSYTEFISFTNASLWTPMPQERPLKQIHFIPGNFYTFYSMSRITSWYLSAKIALKLSEVPSMVSCDAIWTSLFTSAGDSRSESLLCFCTKQ